MVQKKIKAEMHTVRQQKKDIQHFPNLLLPEHLNDYSVSDLWPTLVTILVMVVIVIVLHQLTSQIFPKMTCNPLKSVWSIFLRSQPTAW